MSVVFVHAVESIYVMNAELLNQLSPLSFIFAITGFTFGRLGVPIFLFLTGYLFLDRRFDEADCYKFWKKNWKGLLITTEVWIILYDVFLRVFHFQSWNTMRMIKDMLFMTQVHMGHMWYMPMIVGIYLCIPFAARALQKLNIKVLYFPIGILCVYAFFLPVLQVLNQTFSFGKVTSILDLGFSGGVYGLYIILGLCLKRKLLKNIPVKDILVGIITFFVLTVLLQCIAYWKGFTYNVWYNCGLLLLCSLFLFELFSRMSISKSYKLCNWISRNSFGIYLIHFPFVMLLRDFFKELHIIMPLKVMILWILVLIISFMACIVISKHSKLSKILLYNR